MQSVAGELFGVHVALLEDDAKDSELSSTDWVMVTRNKALLDRPDISPHIVKIENIPGLRVWTDDFNNLFQILK